MSRYSRIRSERVEDACLITLGVDGEICLTAALCEELADALETASADEAVRSIVLTGAHPDIYMRHYSVPEILKVSENLSAQGMKPGDRTPYAAGPIDRCILLAEAAPKPVIAAINGECMGGAMEFSLACDIRFARRGVFRLGQPETALGILPGAGGTQRLARVVGYARAMEHALTGLPVSPEAALAMGMVHALFDDPLAAALERARHFARLPAMALAHTKKLVLAARSLPLDQGTELERALFLDVALNPEGVRLMTDYVEERYKWTFDGERWSVDIPKAR
jgi:enoyl-CoA hydratase/carnithine racemase